MMRQAGADEASLLQTSNWGRGFHSTAQRSAVCQVSSLAAFQHLFELHAKATASLLIKSTSASRLRQPSYDEAEAWQEGLLGMRPWIEENEGRLLAGPTLLILHSMLATCSAPFKDTDAGSDESRPK